MELGKEALCVGWGLRSLVKIANGREAQKYIVGAYLDTVRAGHVSVTFYLAVLTEDAREDPRSLPGGRRGGGRRGWSTRR